MRKKFITLLSGLLVVVMLTGCGVAAAAQAETPEPGEEASLRTLSVSGMGTAFLTPDIAYINIGVQTQGKDATEAVASNNSQTERVISALREAGINANDIQTTNFSIYPQQGYDREGQPTGEVTYMVNNTVYVTVRDLDDIGELLDIVVGAGANSINGIQFDVADRTSALADARRQAVANAEALAQELAQASGVELGQVRSIQLHGMGSPIPVFEGMGGAFRADAAQSEVPISAGQMTVNVEVNVVYDIR